MSESQPAKPQKPTIDQIVDNSIANMAAEGYFLSDEERARVRERAHKELTERLAKAEPKPDSATS